jgi:hypothetical protein
MAWLSLEDRPVKALSLGKITRLMEGDRTLQCLLEAEASWVGF